MRRQCIKTQVRDFQKYFGFIPGEGDNLGMGNKDVPVKIVDHVGEPGEPKYLKAMVSRGDVRFSDWGM